MLSFLPRRRPAGCPDLGVPWRDLEYCVVDVETTGLDLRRDQVIAIGSVIIRAGRIRCESIGYSRVHSRRKVSAEAVSVHGIRDQDLNSAPPLAEVATALYTQLEGRVLVAHAAWIERAFLGRALGRRWVAALPTVDTAALVRALDLAPSGTGYEPEVEVMAANLGLYPHARHHALGDALTTAEAFLALASRLERARPVQAAELVATSRRHTLT